MYFFMLVKICRSEDGEIIAKLLKLIIIEFIKNNSGNVGYLSYSPVGKVVGIRAGISDAFLNLGDRIYILFGEFIKVS